MPHLPRLGNVPSLVLALFASGSACTLTSDDFSPAIAEAQSCEGAPCSHGSGEHGSGEHGSGERGPGEDEDPRASPGEDAPGPPAAAAPPRGSEGMSAGTPIELPAGEEPEPDTNIPAAAVDAGTSEPEPYDPAASVLVGWASLPGLGVATTSGGGSADPVIADTAAALIALAARSEPLVIGISGTLDVPLLELGSNKTLFGTNAAATLRGGIRVRGSADAFVSNVIIRNLNIDAVSSDAEGDGIQIHYAHHVWVDHSSVRDAADGLIDIVHGSDFVTLSFNHFFYTSAAPDPDHRFANLIGHSANNSAEDAGHLNVTLHHNLWGEGVSQAVSARFGLIHTFDNLFASPGNASVITAGLASKLLLENNMFEGVTAPHALAPNSSASLLATGNVYVDTSGAQAATASAFSPDYPYQLGPASELPEMLREFTGPR